MLGKLTNSYPMTGPKLKKGKTLKIGLKVGTQTMIIPASLKGLPDALDKLK